MAKKVENISYYPIALNLNNRLAVVIGGGNVAEQKVEKLLEAKARIRVVSPELTLRLRRLFAQRKISWISRCARSSDLRGASIVLAATSARGANEAVRRWGRRHKALVNAVDNPELSDFISPAVLRVPKAIVTVYTDGRLPELSRDLKNYLKEHWHDFLSYRRGL